MYNCICKPANMFHTCRSSSSSSMSTSINKHEILNKNVNDTL